MLPPAGLAARTVFITGAGTGRGFAPNGWNSVIDIVLDGTACCTLAAGRRYAKV